MLTGIFPNAVKGRRYSIKETAELLGIHRNTLRKYTDAQLIHATQHIAGRQLSYDGMEINRFWKQTATIER
ncbi:MAG: helix-turn-helix domain-containing protein [Bacteroidales bacterium]|nr:helix-turn-helix domain-containing protein [Candidatus Egerieousia equi]